MTPWNADESRLLELQGHFTGPVKAGLWEVTRVGARLGLPASVRREAAILRALHGRSKPITTWCRAAVI
jgi:hypothetical protein